MQLPLPSSEHPQVQVETVTPDATLTTTLDKSQKSADITLPEGTDESRVQHFAHFLDSRGKVISEKMAYLKGSWTAWTEATKEAALAAEKAAKEAALAAEKAAKSAAEKAKAKVKAAAAPVEAKVEEHKGEVEAAVATAEIAAEVAK